MNTLLLEAVDSLINEDKAAQCIKQALIQKMQTKMGINESQEIDDLQNIDESEDEDQLNEDEFIDDDLEDDESFDD